MLNIEKKYDDWTKTHDVFIKKDNKELKIIFGGNLDLYWDIWDYDIDRSEDLPSNVSFDITKENYFLYSLFDKLFSEIQDCKVFDIDESDFLFEDMFGESRGDQHNKLNDSLRDHNNHNLLYHDDIIEWHSDDDEYDKANVVTIKRESDKIILNFERKPSEYLISSYAIRFRNSGSLYEPFNIVFMRMYNELQKYDLNYHQIHIEEYLYQEPIMKKELTK